MRATPTARTGDAGVTGDADQLPANVHADDLCFAKGQATDVFRRTTPPSGTTALVCRFNYSSP